MSKEIQTIRNKLFSKNKSGIIDTMIRIMEHFGYTLEQVKQIPIPTYEYMVGYLNKLDAARKQIKKR